MAEPDNENMIGDTPIELDGNRCVLRPTLRAAKAVNALHGGFALTYQRVAAYDIEAFAGIVAAGLGAKTPVDHKAVEDQVFATGMHELLPGVMRFLDVLTNGGKPIAPQPKSGDDAGNG